MVLEPVERRMTDAQFALVVAGVAAAAAAVIGALILLPRGFGIGLLLMLVYPVIQLLRGARAAHQDAGPRLVIAAAYLQAGSLRYGWPDVTDVSVGPSARVRDRRDRVKIRLNRLSPIRPTDFEIRQAGLELGDQYFDFAIPPRYQVGPSEIAARIEERRGALRKASTRPGGHIRREAPRSHPRPGRLPASAPGPLDAATSPAPRRPRQTRPR